MDADARQDGNGVAYVTSVEKPPFTAVEPHTALFAAFGAVGGIAMAIDQMSEGGKIVETNKIDDPGPSIAKSIAAHLAQETHGPVIAIPLDPKHHGNSDLAASGVAAHARYVVVADTWLWGFVYYPADLTHFHVTYFAGMEMIDAKSGQTILKAKCNYHPVKAEEYSTLPELTANQATTLKAQLQHAADHCAGEFIAKLPNI